GGTFGGNPVACAAAVAVLETVAEPAFRSRSEELGKTLRAGLDAIAARVPAIGEVRGLGPMLALELTEQTPALAAATVAAPLDRPRRVLHPARSLRLRQDDHAPPDRGVRAARRGPDRAGRNRRDPASPVRARRQHRLPGLRALPAHERRRERRLRPARPSRPAAHAEPARRGGAGEGPAGRPRQAAADPALRRSAAARGTRALDRQPPAGPAPRRAARGARP